MGTNESGPPLKNRSRCYSFLTSNSLTQNTIKSPKFWFPSFYTLQNCPVAGFGLFARPIVALRPHSCEKLYGLEKHLEKIQNKSNLCTNSCFLKSLKLYNHSILEKDQFKEIIQKPKITMIFMPTMGGCKPLTSL